MPESAGPDPLAALLEQHLPMLRAYVSSRADRLVLSKESRSDLVQSVCREVVAHIDRFEHRDGAAFRQWLFRTAERKIIDRYRYYTADCRDALREAGLHGADRPGAGPSPSQQAAASEQLERLDRALSSLPAHYREVIRLARLEGLSVAEVAERIGRTENATRNLLSRATGALSDAFEMPAGPR